MLESKRTKAKALIGEARQDEPGQERGHQQSLERAIWMLDQVILSVRHSGIRPHDLCDKSASGLLKYARRELVAQLESGRITRVPESQYQLEDRTILLTQSDPDDRVLALHALRKAGIKHRVVLARDGVEALNYLFGTGHYEGRDTSSMPELVLLDLKMPRLNGTDVLRHMQFNGRTKSLPVLILVSSVEERDALNARSPKPSGYVLKPLDSAELSVALRRLKLCLGGSH
jgi:two-component system response regulator